MNGFLLDTHIWLWHLRASDALAPSLRQEIERRESTIWLSPVSVWEVSLLSRRGRIELHMPIRRWVEEALRTLPVRTADLTHEVALVSEEIDLPHRDPADRFLAATAVVYELTLMTVDPRLAGAPGVPTRSA